MNSLYFFYLLLFVINNSISSFKKMEKDNPLFISKEELVLNAKRYISLDPTHYFCCSGFPLNRETVIEKKVIPNIEYSIPETFIIELSNAYVFSDRGYIVFDKDDKKKFFLDTIWDWEDVHNPIFKNNFKFPATTKIKGKVAVVAQSGADNYYHWMTEILPRINLLERANIDYDYLYVPKLIHKFQRDSLIALHIEETKIIQADSSTFIEADSLIIPSCPSRSTISPAWVINFLRKTFLQQNSEEKTAHKKIYISRKNASIRKFENEEELISLLKKFDVRPIQLEDYSVQQQARLFGEAEVIIAPHGAGLTNLIFARPETAVIELFQYHLDETFWMLSQQLGLRHFCLLALTAEEIEKLKDPVFVNGDGRYANTTLDMDKIKYDIENLIYKCNTASDKFCA